MVSKQFGVVITVSSKHTGSIRRRVRAMTMHSVAILPTRQRLRFMALLLRLVITFNLLGLRQKKSFVKSQLACLLFVSELSADDHRP